MKSIQASDLPLVTRLQSALSRWPLQQQTLILALSGGPDSVALLRALHSLSGCTPFRLVAAHLDHGLRPDSPADADWVRSLCEKLSVECHLASCHIPRPAPDSVTGVESAARTARYQFLKELAVRSGARFVALAHTADDQVETVLHHLIRGTNLRGLAGIPLERPLTQSTILIRPLLRIPRSDILAYLSSLGQDFRTDPSNTDTRFTRNRLRHVVLPLLRSEFNPNVDAALLRTARLAGELARWLNRRTLRLLKKATLLASPTEVRLIQSALAAVSPLLRRAAFEALWRQQNWPRSRMTARHWHQLSRATRKNAPDTSFSLPAGIQFTRKGQLLLLASPRDFTSRQ